MRTIQRQLLALLALIGLLGLVLSPGRPPQALAQATSTTVELEAIADARTQAGAPDVNYPSSLLYFMTSNIHYNWVLFDLLQLPANATIDSAELQFNIVTINGTSNDIEIGRAEGPWSETGITWNTQPAVTWGGPTPTVAMTGTVAIAVTPVVQAWHSGSTPNYGFAARGLDGDQLVATSKDNRVAPKLVITYRTPPEEGPRLDLGDAPDSSNSLGVNPNTAYAGVAGNFPTVWSSTPAGQPAGPRHENQLPGGFLGQYLSREAEADSGNDQDGRNNILDGGADNADNDRGDDGWRNRTAGFDHCRPTTLRIRVSKAAGANLERMFLNVWFDGTRDGDWADRALCTPEEETLAIPASEWIVQNYYVDMTGIPAGGYVDIDVTTEVVLNLTPEQRHWMRFTLSEARAPQGANGHADGRGPHPTATPDSYRFGETEDLLQEPAPPGEDGVLELQKRVITNGEPVDFPDTVTYEIRLRHVGGSRPIQAEIRDEIPYPQHLLPQIVNNQVQYIAVTSPGGGASPLQANLDYNFSSSGLPSQVVSWQGSLAPDSEIRLSFDVHVHPLCTANQQLATIENTARARPRNGDPISAEADFTAKCPGYNLDQFEVLFDDVVVNPLDLSDLRDVNIPYILRNNNPISITLGLALERRTNLPQMNAIALPSFQQIISLGPGEQKPVALSLDLKGLSSDQLNGPDETIITGTLRYCLITDIDQRCPDGELYPQLVREGPPLTIRLRPNDLGDAPDSTNHGGVAMAAYPGTPAGFPTVFDPATGLPPGPRHAHPRPFHLGQQVSLEGEADLGPDQDPANNIEPAANTANLDRFDDGSRLAIPTHCRPTTAEVQVAISPQAWQWFKNNEQNAYLNVWLDSNRDGDWADGFSCESAAGQTADVVEHIVIDEPIDVIGLGPGLHALSVTTGRVAWPAQLAGKAAWLRFTLSERPANKTLTYNGISYGDGRGYATPFKLGETEDHLLLPGGAGEGAPDLAVQLEGRADANQVSVRATYSNVGQAPARDGRLAITLPDGIRSNDLSFVRAPGIEEAAINRDATTINMALPDLPPGEHGTIVIGWPAPAGQGVYTPTARVTVSGDTNSSNDLASVAITAAPPAPRIGLLAADGQAWGRREATCRDSVELVGRGAPNGIIAILIGLLTAGEVTADANGNFSYRLENLTPGRHQIQAVYRGDGAPAGQRGAIWLEVDPTLPLDPLSLAFTDSRGNVIHPPTLGWSFGASQSGSFLRAGETYEVGVDSCLSTPNQSYNLMLDNQLAAGLSDEDGDGRYSASFTYNPPLQRAALAADSELRLEVTANGVSRSFSTSLSPASEGQVVDAASGLPLEDAEVSVLSDDNRLWPAGALGSAGMQASDAGGSYRFGAASDTSRLLVTRSGYQLYRSWDLDGGDLARLIGLTPEFAGPADHTVYISANGFEPAQLNARPGDLIEWVNLDAADHTASGSAFDSGVLAVGERYRVRLDQAGSYSYGDDANPLNSGMILVEGGGLYLPMIWR